MSVRGSLPAGQNCWMSDIPAEYQPTEPPDHLIIKSSLFFWHFV